ncbi:MAG TPA: glycosyltransferase, partial [Isosphaeraceae bacterium]|nr:glycosyltransferase [Isosphaeraceae bacterium]
IGAGPDRSRLESLAGPSVTFLGWQPDEVVRDHFRRCRALLFPGIEDFGIVPAEALACGSPVIALGLGGAAETVAPSMGRLYHAQSPDGLLSALESWEHDGFPFDPQAARARAESLSTTLFRARLLTYLSDVVSRTAPTSNRVPAPHLAV